MNTLIRFLRDRRAVSPVIGTILMVAITVVMGAIVGGFVYQTGKPKMAPNLSTTLEDDVRITLSSGVVAEGRIAKLFIESGARIAQADLNVIATYTDGASNEQTVTLDGASWLRKRGTATGGSTTTLIDSAAGFVVAGVAVGDVVFNLTTGEQRAVTVVAADTLTFATATATAAGHAYAVGRPMGAGNIALLWVDSDGSTDISPGDRLDFTEGSTAPASNVKGNTDFTVKLVHKSSESVLASHTIRVY